VSLRAQGPTARGAWLAWEVEVDSAWAAFAGHFPGRPVLPAIGHLFVVRQLLASRAGPSASIVAVDRLRVTRPILPGARVEVRLQLGGAGESSRFAIEERGEPVSEGSFRWASEGKHGGD